MKYMLDTNICSYIIKKKYPQILDKFSSISANDICISTIVNAELEFGICKSKFSLKNRVAIAVFLSGIEVVSFDRNAAKEYGDIRAALESKGTPIGPNDMFIAAHARALNLTLVTNNIREFSRIENLKLENWV